MASRFAEDAENETEDYKKQIIYGHCALYMDSAIKEGYINSYAFYKRGCYNILAKEFNKAEYDLLKAIDVYEPITPEMEKKYPEKYLKNAFYIANPVKVITAYTKDWQSEIVPNETKESIYYQLGIVELNLGNLKEALENFNMAEPTNKMNPYFYKCRGIINWNLKEYQLAINDYERLTILEKDNAEAYFFKGCCQKSLGLSSGACSSWKKADELGDKRAIKELNEQCR